MVLLALRGENFAKIEEENDKKNLSADLPSRREREKFEKLLKRMFETIKELFLKKPKTRCSIDRKTGSINWTRQRLIEFLKQDFDWSKIRLDQSKFWKNSFSRKKKPEFLKTYLKALNITKQMHEYEMKCSPKNKI